MGTAQLKQRPEMLSVTDLAIRNQLTYRTAWERTLRGDFGQPEKIGRRLYVRASAVEK